MDAREPEHERTAGGVGEAGTTASRPWLTRRFNDALVYAAELHATQVRKGTSIPYIAHLVGVTAPVLEDGGDEDEAIAALLHDAVEDQGGRHWRRSGGGSGGGRRRSWRGARTRT